MKNLIFLFIVLLGAVSLKAQETFFPTKEGTVLIYKTFDKKDKFSSSVKYTVKQVNTMGSNLDITYLCESLDNKENLVFKEEITIHQKGDVMYLDMSNYVNKGAFQQNGEIPAELQVKGNNMEIPLNPQAGQSLPDASVEMAMKMGFVNMKMVVDITNRKVESIEDLTVPAGTFKCYKFTENIQSVILGIKVQAKSTEWYAKGIGTIRTETYDKNGKLDSYTELVSIGY